MTNDKGHKASTRKHYQVTRADLPLSCPLDDMRVWDAHPRVYLPIEETGKAICPYCEAEFTLVESTQDTTNP